jgi:negative regulator of flagellin synthesis FlgM
VSNQIRGTQGSPVDGGSTRGVSRVRSADPAKPAAQGTQGGASTPTDSVHITDTARALLALQDAVASSPEINSPRVEQLRLSIEQQTYQPNAARIADRLLSVEGDLQAASQRKKY